MAAFVILILFALAFLVAICAIIHHILTKPHRRGYNADGTTLWDLPLVRPDTFRRDIVIGVGAVVIIVGGAFLGVAATSNIDAPRSAPSVGFLATSPGHLTMLAWLPGPQVTQHATWDSYQDVPGGQTHEHAAVTIVTKPNLTLTMAIVYSHRERHRDREHLLSR